MKELIEAVVSLPVEERAIDWYEEHEKNLCFDFAREVYTAIGRAAEQPKAWPVFDGEVRRYQTRRFPYGVLHS